MLQYLSCTVWAVLSTVKGKECLGKHSTFWQALPGAYISENSTHYFLPDWAYLGQESCQNTVKEYSEHKIKAIFELSTLENPYIDSLFGLIYEF